MESTIRGRLLKEPPPSPSLSAWLERANDGDLFRINARRLAPTLGMELGPLLDWLFRMVASGALDLNWEYHCPHCNAVPGFTHNFGELRDQAHCSLCQVDFRNELDRNVEVTFSLGAALGGPPAGLVKKNMDETLAARSRNELTMPSPFLSGLDCLTSPVFRELFGEDVLSTEESLSVSRVAFLFTDIKGSTALYSRVGDAMAYRLVREHFKILFNRVERAGGTVVKTIGDAVMAAFARPDMAADAAIACYEEFQRREFGSVGKFEIKMGIHAGPAIVVTMNDRLDYFGSTVNLAARVQQLAENHTVYFTADVARDPPAKAEIAAWLLRSGGRVVRKRERLKGIESEVDVYRIVEKA